MSVNVPFFHAILLLLSSVLQRTHWTHWAHPKGPDRCPGYTASNVLRSSNNLTADLSLAGAACNVYGQDFQSLKFLAEWQTDSRLHMIIYDKDEQIYQVPDSVLPRPSGLIDSNASLLDISIQESPFAFTVIRKSNGEEIFSTKGSNLVFESQYWRLRTSLPDDPSLYGLGEHTDSLRLPTSKYTRTMWARDAGAVPQNQNLYGTHPIYYENRESSGNSHGVFLLNSNGMDIKIGNEDGQYLEYNVIGGVIDLYFLAGPSPFDVARQYSEITQKAALLPYWSFGFHNCRYGYESVGEVTEVVANYSKANIPLETMWTDIDYMDGFKIFTLGRRFSLGDMQHLVKSLHSKNQHYVLMIDPAVAAQDYGAYQRGLDLDVFLKNSDKSLYKGRVWPGETVYPDWFHKNTQRYWNDEFTTFFDLDTGVDIDALWIDMNEPANFCDFPCGNPISEESLQGLVEQSPKSPSKARPISPADVGNFISVSSQAKGSKTGLPGRNLIEPPYKIKNEAGNLSDRTINTNLVHWGGYVEYDTHSLYGTMMSLVSRESMLKRRPNKRPLVVTRSTFAGAGRYAAHWLGDNVSAWDQYVASIRHLLQFVSMFQVPMVGADVCGFLGDTNEHLCARWTVLGAFYPFYRNHNVVGAVSQEAYRWPSVAAAARKAIDIRYRLLDYIYTAMYKQTVDGIPMLAPLWMIYPTDNSTRSIQTQFFYGPSLLVNPVTEEASSSVSFYLPRDIWYDFATLLPVSGAGSTITYSNVTDADIPVLVRGGSIVPLRVKSAMTTAALRGQSFELLIAPNKDGKARGSLYLDDGESLVQRGISEISFNWDGSRIQMAGSFGFAAEVGIKSMTLLGTDGARKCVVNESLNHPWEYHIEALEWS